MFYIGKPSNKELNNYALVLKTLNYCEEATQEKRKFSQLYDLAIKIFGDNAEFFTHALGHGLGLDIHETPSLHSEDKNKILDNITFTIEPGIYFPNKYGIRIEDTVTLKNERLIILTKSTKGLVII
jgi:Xaa-Pro aminopeptidase